MGVWQFVILRPLEVAETLGDEKWKQNEGKSRKSNALVYLGEPPSSEFPTGKKQLQNRKCYMFTLGKTKIEVDNSKNQSLV